MASLEEQTKQGFYGSPLYKRLSLPEFKSKEEIKEGLTSLTEGQVPAAIAGSTVEVIELIKDINDINAKYGGNTKLFSHLAKPLVDKVQKEAGREKFTKVFNELAEQYDIPFKDDPNNPFNIIGDIIGLGGAAKLGKVAVESTVDLAKQTKNIFKDPPDIGPQPEFAGVGNIGNVEDATKQTDKIIDKTPPSSQAKATINPTVIGLNTATGKKQAKTFNELEAQNKFTPEELFEKTGVYRSNKDGKLRYDLDDSNASLKLKLGERANLMELGEPISLDELFDFPDLYKEYGASNVLKKMQDKITGKKTFQPLKDIKVKFIRKPEFKYNAAYDTDTDSITINMANMINDKDLLESKIIHEIQHAVQHREGFPSGGSSLDIIENLPRSNEYLKIVNKYGEDKDPLVASIQNFDTKKQEFFEDQLIDIDKQLIDEIDSMTFLGTRNDNTRFLEYLGELENKLLKQTNLDEKTITRIKGNLSKLVNDHRQEKTFIENMQSTAMEQYKNLYGEREAKLVEKIYDRRKNRQPSQNNLLVSELGGGQKNQKFDTQKKNKGISYDLDLYHGSNKDFGKFDSGEIKDAAFGYGINLSNKPEIGKFYGNKLYKTKVSIKPDEILDYDKPINQQPKEIQEKIKKVADDVYDGGFRDTMTNLLRDNYKPEEITGKVIYKKIGTYGKLSDKQISKKLSEFGIKGLKHKAGFLQGAKTEDSVNYVLFDSDLINIVGKDIQTKHNDVIKISKKLEKTPIKSNLALQKISKQFNKSELDANGVPKNILKDKDGKPLILYYGDSGYTYVPPKLGEKASYVDKGQPGKLIDKFSGAGRIGKGNFTTTNPFLASTYASASDKGSVIPVYIMAEKVIDAKKTGVDGVMAFDKAADRLGKNEVIVGNFGFDANAVGKDNLFKTLGKENYIKQMQEAGQKYTDTQYAFTGDTQVFSAISGEKLSKYNKGGIAKQMSNLGV